MDVSGPVAIIAAGELFGGAERHVLGLGAFLRERGLRPRVIAFNDRELAARCRDDELPITVLQTRSSYDLAGPRRLDRILGDERIRLVHVHGYRAAVNAALAPTRRPFVCTLHGEGEPSWRAPRDYATDRTYRAAEAWACRRRRATVCFVSDDLRRRHASRYRGLDCRTVRNGITPLDRAACPPPNPPLAPGRLHAVTVGRLTRVKGLESAIRAFSLLGRDHPWHLDIVGSGELLTELTALSDALGTADRVTFHGFRRDVASIVARADAFLMPSFHEGLPYALLEAMSLGVPTIASDVGGLAEVLRHEHTGLLLPVGDAPALAAALARLAGNAGLRAALGSAAAAEQRRAYTLATMGESYLAAYGHAAANAGAT